MCRCGAAAPSISIHALREEGDYMRYGVQLKEKVFLSTPSARRATIGLAYSIKYKTYFYPRPPRGGRPLRIEGRRAPHLFLSTPSARRATLHAPFQKMVTQYFYPRPPRGGRQTGAEGAAGWLNISMHALREEGDPRKHRTRQAVYISIHALREEGDLLFCRQNVRPFLPFLSTPSARRAT